MKDAQLTKTFASAVTDLKDGNVVGTIKDMYDALIQFKSQLVKALSQAGFKAEAKDLKKVLSSKVELVYKLAGSVAAISGVLTDYIYDLATATTDGYVTVTLNVNS